MDSLIRPATGARLYAVVFMLLCSLLTILPAGAAPTPSDAELAVEDLQARLDRLDPNDTAPQTRTLRDLYQQTLTALNALQNYQNQAQTFNQSIEAQPRQLDRMRAQYAAPTVLPATPPNLGQLNLTDLEQRLILRRAELVKLEQKRDQLALKLGDTDQRLITLREKLAELKQSSAPPSALPADASAAVKEASDRLQRVRARERAAQIQAMELELLLLPGERELTQLELNDTKRQVDQLAARLNTLQEQLQKRRRQELESSLSELEPVPSADTLPPLLASEQRQNQQYTEQLRTVLERIDQVTETQATLTPQLEQIRQSYSLLTQQLELAITPLSGELRGFTRQLTRPLNVASTRSEINALRLRNLMLGREQLNAEQARTSPPETIAALPTSDQQLYRVLLQNRLLLIERLQQSRQRLITELSQTLSIEEQINEQLSLARQLIDRHLLWQPTVSPLSLSWLQELREGIRRLPQQWQSFTSSNPLLPARGPLTLIIAAPLLLWLLAALTARYLRRHRDRWLEQLGNVTHDRFDRTLRLLLAAPLMALPLPVFTLLLSRYGLDPTHPAQESLRLLLWVIAGSTFPYLCLRQWLRTPWGLFSGHLGIPLPLCHILRRELHLLYWSALVLLIGLVLCDAVDDASLLSSAGRLLMLLLILVLLRFWWVLKFAADDFNRLTRQPHWWSDARLWIGALLTFNLLMALLVIAGYLISALFLILVLTALVLQVVLTFILYRLGLRWLTIAQRRMELEQARERRAEQLAARDNSSEEITPKASYLDLSSSSDQARLLLKIAALTLFMLMLWLTLGDLLPSLRFLDNIELWSAYQTTPEGDVLRATTLGDVLGGMLILSVSLIAAHNLPGLLELLVLRHVKLTLGSNYAITTLLKYSLILIGVMSAIGQFGLQWSKLQWLVAALGVGLGFGLQEIVANFVSGLILLFEKPIRIGDTVTIGGVSGNVSSIRIRATTIIDWDRKEVVIPNKTFITEQLINWTLTDAITRVVIRVGVAYGSDTEQALQLLLEAARSHDLVLKDPEPSAYFLEFANSTLNLELRVYVNALADRIPVTDALNKRIDALFREHDIEIAFPQLDVHLHRTKA